MGSVKNAVGTTGASDTSNDAPATVGGLLRRAAERSPDVVALRSPSVSASELARQWTYAELYEASKLCAGRLAREFEPGERIAVWSDNRPEWILLQFGAALAGLVIVTVNPAYKADEAEFVLTQSEASACFAVDEYRGHSPIAVSTEISHRLPTLRAAYDLVDWVNAPVTIDPSERLPVVEPGDPAMIQYTSGTTGLPKGALLPHWVLASNAVRTVDRVELPINSVWMATTPLFHVAGSVVAVLGSVVTDSTIVLMPAWSTERAFEFIEAERVTVTNAVPTMLQEFVDHPQFASADLSSLRTILTGASSVPAELVRRLEAGSSACVQVMYGQTECGGSVTMTHRGDSDSDREETIGTPLSGIEMKIVDTNTGAEVGVDEPGELLVRGATMIEYFRNPEATTSTIDADGWLHTGDVCIIDHRGYIRISGRIKDMIIRGGENIYPRELEERIVGEDAVADVAVVGLPDSKWGEIVAAVVVSNEGVSLDKDSLTKKMKEQIASYKVPSRWYVAPSLPRTPTGKIQKFKIQADALEGLYPEL